MTKTQILAILSDMGFSANRLINMMDVSSIYLTTDHMLYPDETSRFYFKTDNNCELLLVYDGKEIGGEFISSSKLPKYICSFDIISGFYNVNELHIKKPYTMGLAV